MKNFPSESFLYVKLFEILFVGKVKKTRTTSVCINLLLNVYKQSTISIVERILLAMVLSCVSQKFQIISYIFRWECFRRVECKKY